MLTSQQPSVNYFEKKRSAEEEKKARRESKELLMSGCLGIKIAGTSCLMSG